MALKHEKALEHEKALAFFHEVSAMRLVCKTNPSHIQTASGDVFRAMLADPYLKFDLMPAFKAFYGCTPEHLILKLTYGEGIDIHWTVAKFYFDPPLCIYSRAILKSPEAIAYVPTDKVDDLVEFIEQSKAERSSLLVVFKSSIPQDRSAKTARTEPHPLNRLSSHGVHFAKQFKCLIAGFTGIEFMNQNHAVFLANA